jgi:hypothetical protein
MREREWNTKSTKSTRNAVALRFMCLLCFLCSFFCLPGKAQEQKQPEDAQVKTETVQVQPKAEPAQPDDPQQKKDEDGKLISVPGGKALGMSILGNQEAPKALVIVPWKSSELGNVQGISTLLDDSKQPIDKDVFMRMLSYYEIRSETARPDGAPAKTNAAQPNTATSRRK